MRRRELIKAVAGLSVVAGVPTLRAQQSALPVIGFLGSQSPGEAETVVAAFRQGLRESGYIEGQNLRIVFRWAEDHYEKLPALASELVSLPVALLFTAGGPPSALAAKDATSTIPIVFSAASNPVEMGLVPSLNQPGGNVTGMATFNDRLGTKRLELLKELMPNVRPIGYLLNPADRLSEIEAKDVTSAARILGLDMRTLDAKSESDLESVFAGIQEMQIGGLVVSGAPFFLSKRQKVVGLAARSAVPAIYAWREYVLAGGLISYGTDLLESYRQAAIYAGRILKGERPPDLPVAQPTKFYVAINVKTANALGLDVPSSLLVRADEVIE
jgi:putative ABC transport system substrate-binding protein